MNSMKKINAYMQLLLLSVVLLSISCTGDFENMNRNPNEVTDGQMDALNYKIGTKFQSLQGLVVPVQEHMYQFNESLSGGPFGGYIGATVDSWLTKFETFNPSADWRKWPFANVITETYTPWRGIVTGTDDEVAVAFAKLLRVAIMHRVTDSYGPIPYSNLETNESITVKYDKQEEVYMKMFGELDEAIAAFAANTTLPAEAFSRYDRVYGGNIAQWLKYANSLKLRMAIRMSGVEPEAQRIAEEAVAASEKRHTHSLLYSLYTMGNDLPLGDQVFILQSRIIKQLAEEGPCVILGRCGDYVLRDRKDVLRVFIYAPVEWRRELAKTDPLVKAHDEKGIKEEIEKNVEAFLEKLQRQG